MIYIRADANEIIGTGHVMRCLSIANEFRRRGEEVTFIVADENSKKSVETKGFKTVCLHSVWDDLEKEIGSFTNFLKENHVTFLIIDTYYVTEKYLQAVGEYTKIIYIDDLDICIYPVDMLVNYNIYADELNYHERYRTAGLKTRFMLGCRYAPLRDEFINVKREIKENVSDIMITSGGTDRFNVIGKFLDILEKQDWFKQMEYNVILGKFHVHKDVLEERWAGYGNIHFLENINNMSDYMKKCDIAVTAGGVTTYELCACGIPSVMYTLADNQIGIAKAVSDKRLMPWAGDVRENIDECMISVVSHMQMLIKNADKRRRVSEKMQELVDGRGCERLVEEILTFFINNGYET